MSSAPDPADVTGPDPPRDPADYSPRRRGLGAAFWAMIAFGVFCAIAGLIVGRYGPQLFPKKGETPAASSSPASAQAPPATPADASATRAPAASSSAAPAADVAALSARIDGLQASQRRTADAAGAALAAAALSEAAQSSRPFAGQLGELEGLLPDSAELRALQPLAQSGAPSRAALAAEFARQADRASVASRAPPANADVLDRLRHLLSSIFTVRRIAAAGGTDPDAILARAQRAADEGDLDTALRETAALPPTGREALADWRAGAQRRADIDRLVAAVREDAVKALAAAPERAAPT